jgi:hypothetical protein
MSKHKSTYQTIYEYEELYDDSPQHSYFIQSSYGAKTIDFDDYNVSCIDKICICLLNVCSCIFCCEIYEGLEYDDDCDDIIDIKITSSSG